MARIIVVGVLILFSTTLLAQAPVNYNWENKRERYKLNEKEESLPEIILKEHIEYIYTFEKDQFIVYNVYHRIARLNNVEAIQRHNRISIPMNRTFELVELKARTINLNGQVVNFDKKNLKEVQQENGEKGSRIFAMEGVIIGSEVEYYYVRKMSPLLQETNYLQLDVPIKQLSFLLKSPKHLVFDFKSYNGLAAVKATAEETENVYALSMTDIPSMPDEDFAFSDAQKMRLEYKLAYNTAKSQARINTWEDAGKRFYASICTAEKEEQKSIDKFVKTLKDNPSLTLPQRIRNIERKLKTTINIDTKGSSDALEDITSIVKYQVASRRGITRLMMNLFEALKIPAQLVLTCSREFASFDSEFDTWNYLDEFLIYFPETKEFLSPYNLTLSYPIVDPEFTSQNGLFMEPVSIGTLKSAIASIHHIHAAPYTYNTDDMDITVKFADNMEENIIDLTRDFNGVNASYFAPFYNLMSEEQKLAMVDELMKQTAPGLTINKWDGKVNLLGEVDQFELHVNYSSSHFIERAGPRVLFKVGLLIGPQTQLYNEDERVNPVENEYNRGYDRVIKITIPDGYIVKNPNDINFSVLYKDGDNLPYSFVSNYTLEGHLLTITIKEYYKQINAPVDRYKDYRAVINAAADFNKVTLILEKRK